MTAAERHFSEEEIVDCLSNRLSDAETTDLRSHLKKCDLCATLYDSTAQIYSGLEKAVASAKKDDAADVAHNALSAAVRDNRISWAVISPQNFVPVGVAATRKGLAQIQLNVKTGQDFADLLAARHKNRMIKQSREETGAPCDQLLQYFAGERKSFNLPVDESFVPEKFQQKVLEALTKVPFGQTRTYGDLAHALGKPGASRAVGMALGRNPIPIVLPCHRIIAAGGELGGFTGGLGLKKSLLRLEGVRLPALQEQTSLFDQLP